MSRDLAPAERTLTAWLRLSRAPHPSATQPTVPLPAHAERTLRRVRTIIVTALAALVAVIALLAFVASFDKISAYAVAEVAWPTRLRWIPPLLVDSFTFVGTLLVVWLSLSATPRRKATAYGWLLVATGTAASVIVNVEHAPPTLAGRIIAGSPPVALLLAIEALVLVLRYLLSDLTVSPAAPAHPSPHPSAPSAAWTQALRLPDSQADIADAPTLAVRALAAGGQDAAIVAQDAEDAPSAALRAQIEQLWRVRERDGGQRLIGTHLARELGTPARHVQAVLRDLRAQGAQHPQHEPPAPDEREGSS
jgi:Protein of unknown function (DUF2637)